MEAVEGKFEGLPTTRAELQLDSRFRREFVRQKERVAAMDFRVAKIVDNFESYVFEPYAALMLDTPYNSWATSATLQADSPVTLKPARFAAVM